jgi:HCOMODA/2-hydroxy-3-carboxy-muconic semialdehyde decarboxylase
MKTRVFLLCCAAVLGCLTAFLLTSSPGQTALAQGGNVSNRALIDELVLANRILASQELRILDTHGHVSVRNPQNPNRYFIARYISAGVVTASDIYEADLDSRPVAGDRNDIFSERFIHGEIYKARPDVNAVIHAHPAELVAFSVSSVPLHANNPIPNFDIRRFDGGQGGLVSNPVLGARLAESLGRSNAALMLAHGVVVVGNSLTQAVGTANTLRETAEVQLQATALRGQVTFIEFGPRQTPPGAGPRGGAGATGANAAANAANRPMEYWKRLVAGEVARQTPAPPVSTSGAANASDQAVINDVVLANRILASRELKILSAYGHVSARSRQNPNRYFISTDVSPGMVVAADVIENDLDSKAISDTRSQYQERFIHGEIYKARPDVMAIVHAHTPEFVAFGQSSIPMRTVFNRVGFIGEGLPNYDIRKYTGGGPAPVGCAHCISTPELGQAMVKELGRQQAILLYGHGVVITGTSIADMVSRSNDLRKNAEIQQMAISLGGTVTYLDAVAGPGVSTAGTGGGTFFRDWEFWKQTVPVAVPLR